MSEQIDPLKEAVAGVEAQLDDYAEQGGYSREQLHDMGLLDDLRKVWSISDYVAESCRRYPKLLGDLQESGDLLRAYPSDSYKGRLAVELNPDSSPDLMTVLRSFRRREMVRIIWRDVTRSANFETTVLDLSNLADACIEVTLEVLYSESCQTYGTPFDRSSKQPQQLIVLALGKLGGMELNLSSDIDLVFLYGEQGYVKATDRSQKDMSNQEFFLRLARKLIHTLSESRHDGFVFRVDMRLRPYGDSGALVLARSAMEHYYEKDGRDWERYAFIKARAVAGDLDEARSFLNWLNPFVYRKYLDYGAIESLRSMKKLINSESESKALANDIKLGPGGIREIEFIAQSYQLIWGARDTRLQEQKLLKIMGRLQERGDLDDDVVTGLTSAYLFLRNSEHVIQAESDRQTQILPASAISRSRLASAMGFQSWPRYLTALDQHRDFVAACFQQVIQPEADATEDLPESNLLWERLWQDIEDKDVTDFLEQSGFSDGAQVSAQLSNMKMARNKNLPQALEVERIDRLLPKLLNLVSRERDPDTTLSRVLSIVEAILRRSTYLVYLLENPPSVERMIKLCGKSPWVAEQLRKQPMLLYELRDYSGEDDIPSEDDLKEALKSHLSSSPVGDLEEQMDHLRQFKNACQLKAAALELSNLRSVMVSSDLLTALAETILQQVLDIAWGHLVERHGRPKREDGEYCNPDFAVIAYGKLGGYELGFGSDLDLVFIHNGAVHAQTEGPKQVANSTFFNRLGQRIIHILNSFTSAGILYDIDVRLRPAGGKGVLVSSIEAFETYQQDKAWTFEHQALVRVRFVAGDRHIGERFEKIRRTVLETRREPHQLRTDIIEMRQRMRSLERRQDHESQDDNSLPFDLKHALGAIVDIEFMVQYAVLAWSHKYPDLCGFTDNYRLLGMLQEFNLLDKEDVDLLRDAYLAYRSAVHFQALGGQLFISAYSQLAPYREKVVIVWRKLMHNTG